MKCNPLAVIVAGALLCSANSHAEEGADGTAARKAAAMIQAVEALAEQARLHHQARQRLIDASALVERRATIIELQAKCQKHGYSCIQPGDFSQITLAPNRKHETEDKSPSDSSSLRSMMKGGADNRERGKELNMMTASSAMQFSSSITWLGHTHNTVKLKINGQTVTALLDQKIPGTPYTIRKIRPYQIVLGDQGGGIRIVPVVWPNGSEGSANERQNGGFPQYQMPSSPADSSMQLPLGRPPRAS
ncbi:MAG: hypothetical protein JAZ11_02720 [Candidatus Thiodiazotropha lotti]|nr:hypothetical protein [Candidatus Thiodiazotropha lotti]